MYKPKYRKIMIQIGHPYLDVKFENDVNQILSFFMNIDVKSFGKEILGMLEDVLNDKVSNIECGFNASVIIIIKVKTSIVNLIIDDDDELIIDTYELYSLVYEWLTKLNEFEELGFFAKLRWGKTNDK